MFKIQSNVSSLMMVIDRAILAIIFLFGYGFAQPGAAESSNSLRAEATVEIHYDGKVGSGIILMTSYPASCTTSNSTTIISSLSTVTSSITTLSASMALIASSPSITETWTSSTSSIHFNMPPPFGTSRTQMINATSTGQYLFPS